MLSFGLIISSVLLSILILSSMVVGMPSARAEVGRLKLEKSMRDIPQWHCLRFFKHDVHLQRRCRNHRIPMYRRLSE